MAHYEHLRSTPAAWRDILSKMDITSTEFRSRDKDQGKDKKRSYDGNRKWEDRISLHGGSAPSTNEKAPRVPSPVVRKRRQEERYLKCGRKGHFAGDCKTGWQAKTPPPCKPQNANQQPVSNKRQRTDQGHLKITELGSEESGNE